MQANRCGTAGKVKDRILDDGYFDTAGAEMLREVERDLGRDPDAGDSLDILFMLIGYREPNAAASALAANDAFAPLFGPLACMSGTRRISRAR